jgi:hypothetical protein
LDNPLWIVAVGAALATQEEVGTEVPSSCVLVEVPQNGSERDVAAQARRKTAAAPSKGPRRSPSALVVDAARIGSGASRFSLKRG